MEACFKNKIMEKKDINKEKIDAIIDLDPLSEAEKLTGTSYKGDNFTSFIGMMLQMDKGSKMEKLMDETDDTKLTNKESDYLRKVTNLGFESILVEPFQGRHVEERLHCLWHKDYSILLVFDTYSWDGSEPSVNSAKMYYNWSPNKEKYDYRVTSSGGFIAFYADENFVNHPNPTPRPTYEYDSYLDTGEKWKEYNKKVDEWNLADDKYIEDNNFRKVWEGDHDAREAIKYHLNNLLEQGVFVTQWLKLPFLWIVNHVESDVENFDYKKISLERVAKFPLSVQKAMSFNFMNESAQ